MKIATLFLIGMFLTTVAMADDAEDVKRAALATYDALNNADVEAYVQWVAPEGTLYGGNGSLLQERSDTTEALRANLQGMFDAGMKYDYRMRNLDVKVYGDSAVVTGYVVGSRTAPDGVARQVTLRRTMVWTRQGGAYVGLCPRRAQSGKRDPQLRITKAGDRMVRRLLVQCAHYIMGAFGEDSDLRRHGEKIAAGGGKNAKKRAVVAVARKLAVVMHHLWVTGEVYEPLYNTHRQAA